MARHSDSHHAPAEAGSGAMGTLAAALVIVALAGGLIWLALNTGDRSDERRFPADRRALSVTVELPDFDPPESVEAVPVDLPPVSATLPRMGDGG